MRGGPAKMKNISRYSYIKVCNAAKLIPAGLRSIFLYTRIFVYQVFLYRGLTVSSSILSSPDSTEFAINPSLSFAPTQRSESTIPSSPPSESSESDNSTRSTLSPPDSIPVRRPRTCWVYRHMPAQDPDTTYLNKRGMVEWRCKYCSRSYATNGGNHCIKKHLLEKHGKTEKSSRENITAKRQRSIEHALELSEYQSFKRRKLNTCGGTGQSISGSHLEVLLRISAGRSHVI
jgi:hypothetical protein